MRNITFEEKKDLHEFIVNRTYINPTDQDKEDEWEYLKNIHAVVFDDYITDCPGYAGRVMMVMYSGSPTFYEAFIWQNGKLEKVETEI